MKSLKFAWALPLAALLILAACNKDNVENQFDAVAEDVMMLKSEQVSGADADAVTLKCPGCDVEAMRGCMQDDCADITDSGEGTFPRTITLDYGDGCEDARGHVKKGKIVIVVSAEMDLPGAVRTTTFDNFFVDDRQMIGTRTLTNTSGEAAVNPSFAFSDVVEMIHDGRSRSKTAEGTRTWIAGFDTRADRTDDIFEMTGISSMSCREGQAMSRTIIEPVVFDAACGYPVSGIVEMTKPRGGIITLNFGDGTCDDQATVTHDDGTTETVDLDDMPKPGKGRK